MNRTDRTDGSRLSTGIALFGEVVITGAVVAVLCLPVVTALPALAAGTAHLRRHLAGERTRVPDLLRDFAAGCRTLWPAALAFPLLALLLLWNLSLAQADYLPGSGAMVAVTTLLLAGWAVVLLRTAALWDPSRTDPVALVREAAETTGRDVAGSVLLAFACGMCLVFVWMLLPLALLPGGLLPLAALSVEARRLARERAAEPEAR
ncbi:hypothetical protein [Streptomyces sp. RFCAC02]|uniref:hypothetical protein n=1 Tax=Streptomyces sp. RFCAC02 TaxID=2499143 RepID=UPI0010221F55|nr:hypothetical protein [Streptomyces sp. RFCAC02]